MYTLHIIEQNAANLWSCYFIWLSNELKFSANVDNRQTIYSLLFNIYLFFFVGMANVICLFIRMDL